ncbi:hypothetical protein HanPSC8_Chr17g0747011 [Helianthus annuus]|nr:hypothetical protein HanPSC8_Chr17g0747011 [Helianthus annuus]
MYITCVNFFKKKKKKNIGSFEFPGFSKLKWVFYRYLHYIYIYIYIHYIYMCVCKLKKVMNKLLFYICVSKKNLKLKK